MSLSLPLSFAEVNLFSKNKTTSKQDAKLTSPCSVSVPYAGSAQTLQRRKACTLINVLFLLLLSISRMTVAGP